MSRNPWSPYSATTWLMVFPSRRSRYASRSTDATPQERANLRAVEVLPATMKPTKNTERASSYCGRSGRSSTGAMMTEADSSGVTTDSVGFESTSSSSAGPFVSFTFAPFLVVAPSGRGDALSRRQLVFPPP